MFRRLHRSAILGAVALAGCNSHAIEQPAAAVNFVLVAPLCSSVLPVELSIDGVRVGTDTFRVGLANPHTVSRSFDVTAGQHVLGARVTGGYVWPGQTATVLPGTIATDSLPFYCS